MSGATTGVLVWVAIMGLTAMACGLLSNHVQRRACRDVARWIPTPRAPTARCAHASAVAVESVVDPSVTLAHWCPKCEVQLPAAWGRSTSSLQPGRMWATGGITETSPCDDCWYVEVPRRQCEPDSRLRLLSPCDKHRVGGVA